MVFPTKEMTPYVATKKKMSENVRIYFGHCSKVQPTLHSGQKNSLYTLAVTVIR